MSVSGLCEICESRTIEDQCDLCGRLVCTRHYDAPSGLCTDCLSKFGRKRPEETPPKYPDGVEEYEF